MGFFKSKKPPQAPILDTPPKVEELIDVIDEITRTEAITVTGADGKKRRVIRNLPKTREEELLHKQAEDIMSKVVNNILALEKYDPSSMIDFKNIIDAFSNINDESMKELSQIANFGNIEKDVNDFRNIRSNILKEKFLSEETRLNERLAHQGLADSTIGREERNLLSRNQTLAGQEADLQALQFGETLANNRLARNTNIYQLNEMGRQGRLRAAQTEYELAKQKQTDLEQMRQNAIAENMNQMQIASGILGNDLNRSMGSQANTAALNQMQVANAAQMNNYNANINRLTQQHKMRMDAFNARPPSFGDFAMRLGGMGAGSFMSGAGSQLGTAAAAALI